MNLEEELLSTQKNKPSQTIVAPASALVSQAVGVVRLSGDRAWSIAQLFIEDEKLPSPGRFSYRRIINPVNKQLIDDGLVLTFKSPISFTGEDCVEIQVHGSPSILKLITSCAISLGAKHANPGEFSYRAFINCKKSLTQLEYGNAIAHLSSIQTTEGISEAVKSIRSNIESILTHLEAQISFPNDLPNSNGIINMNLHNLSRLVKSILDSSSKPDLPKVIIAGPPNAGKSTLFNHFIGFDRTVVSNQSGTTRDYVKVEASIDGKAIELIDGPGLDIDTPDSGQSLMKRLMGESDLVLWLDPEAKPIAGDKRLILVQSLSDIPHPINNDWIQLSVKQKEGLSEVTQIIKSHLKNRHYIVTKRQHDTLKRIDKNIVNALNAGNPDMIAYDLSDALKLVSQLDGINLSTKMISEIFSTFCIGK